MIGNAQTFTCVALQPDSQRHFMRQAGRSPGFLSALNANWRICPNKSRWISCRKRFFLPLKVLRRMFRGKFLAFLTTAFR